MVQRAVAEAERCVWSCADEVKRVGEQRSRLTGAMEAEAQLQQVERQRTFDARRASERERERELGWQREKEAQTIAHRHRLELMEARAAAERLAESERRERQVAYLMRLSPEQRAARLERCRAAGQQCDDLTELLVSAAASAAEMRALVDRNEAPPDSTREAS
jgi:hypothetical protein